MLPAGQPFFLFREDFSILSYDLFKILILNNLKSYWEGRELTFPAKYSQHIETMSFKNSSFSLPSDVSELSSGQKTILSRREFVRKRGMIEKA